jgi:hypothetical protein
VPLLLLLLLGAGNASYVCVYMIEIIIILYIPSTPVSPYSLNKERRTVYIDMNIIIIAHHTQNIRIRALHVQKASKSVSWRVRARGGKKLALHRGWFV